MGGAIGAIGIMMLVLLLEGIANAPAAMERKRKSRAEDRFFRRKYRMEIK